MNEKDCEIKVRISRAMKQNIVSLANARGEGESVIVREALNQYLARTSLAPAPVHRLEHNEQPTPYRAGLNSAAPSATPAEAAAAQVAQAAAASPAHSLATGAPSARASQPSKADQLRRGARPKPQASAQG